MAVLPGSLDYLYHNGIIDHIPYEAYEMVPMTASGQAQFAGMGMGYGFSSPLNYGNNITSNTQINASQYLNQAQNGHLYNSYMNPDTFVRRNSTPINSEGGYSIRKAFIDGEGYGRDYNIEHAAWGQDTKGLRNVLSGGVSKVKDTVTNSPIWLKGLVTAGIMLGTLACILKGKKYPVPQAPKKNFFQKVADFFKK